MENERLKKEVVESREQLLTSESSTQYKIESALRESQRTVSRLRNDEQRCVDLLRHLRCSYVMVFCIFFQARR